MRQAGLATGAYVARRIKCAIIPWARSRLAAHEPLDIELLLETITFDEWHRVHEGVELVFFNDPEVNRLFKDKKVTVSPRTPPPELRMKETQSFIVC